MLSAKYYRRQAELCVRLANAAATAGDAARFATLALDLFGRALDAETAPAEDVRQLGPPRVARTAA